MYVCIHIIHAYIGVVGFPSWGFEFWVTNMLTTQFQLIRLLTNKCNVQVAKWLNRSRARNMKFNWFRLYKFNYKRRIYSGAETFNDPYICTPLYVLYLCIGVYVYLLVFQQRRYDVMWKIATFRSLRLASLYWIKLIQCAADFVYETIRGYVDLFDLNAWIKLIYVRVRVLFKSNPIMFIVINNNNSVSLMWSTICMCVFVRYYFNNFCLENIVRSGLENQK